VCVDPGYSIGLVLRWGMGAEKDDRHQKVIHVILKIGILRIETLAA
jgi:hypothetical protein